MNDYVKTIRKLIGNETLITIGCGAIIEDDKGRILLQHRKDKNNWGIPGGIMEIGETVVETVMREVYEETGLSTPYPIEPTSSSLYSGLGGRKEGPNNFVNECYFNWIAVFAKHERG